MSRDLEESSQLELDFEKLRKVAACPEAVIPAVAQDIESGLVLIIGYVNKLALETATREQRAVFWSTSRNELWIKGATSGDVLELVETRVNCEQNSILYLVRPTGGGACHTRDASGRSRASCFYRSIVNGELKHVPVDPPWAAGHG